MLSVCPVVDAHVRSRRVYLMFAIAMLTSGSVSCASDAPTVIDPVMTESAVANASDANAIVVTNSAELVAALVPENAGRRIRVRSGTYNVGQPLFVPDRVTLEGEGEMVFDGSGLPTGFAAGTRTTITMTANTAGDVLTLGDGAAVRGIAIEDLPGRVGNVIAVNSREAGDRLSATIAEVEILNPNAHAVVPSGPSGCGVTVLTLNPNLGSDPPPHSGAAISATIRHSLIRSPSMGVGCGVFAFNFASLGSVSVSLSGNAVGGGIVANGGVSRPDAVHDSRTVIHSQRSIYRDDSADPCVARHVGWNLTGGSGTPAPFQISETARNTLSMRSVDDRIEGFTTAVNATGTRRFFGLPTAGASIENHLGFELIGAVISTSSCGGAAFVADFRMAGALVTNASVVPGDGNTLRAVFRNVTASGPRSNVYADVLGPTGPVTSELQGTGNRLEFVGSLQAFEQTNSGIDPAPGVQFFTGGT